MNLIKAITNNMKDFIEAEQKEFEKKFIEPANHSYRTAVSDQTAPYRTQLENMLEAREFVSSSNQRLIDKIVEMVEGKKKESEKFVPFQKIHYQSALDDILTTLKGK